MHAKTFTPRANRSSPILSRKQPQNKTAHSLHCFTVQWESQGYAQKRRITPATATDDDTHTLHSTPAHQNTALGTEKQPLP